MAKKEETERDLKLHVEEAICAVRNKNKSIYNHLHTLFFIFIHTMSNEATNIETNIVANATSINAIGAQSIIDSLNWRYATKRYDTTKKLSQEQVQCIKDALRLSPSSFGLQAWKFVHVVDAQVREQLKTAAYGQPQLTEASDIFVIASYGSIDEKFVEKYIKSVADVRGVPVDALQGFGDMLIGAIKGKVGPELKNWLSHQVYIALGVALTVAATQGIDASPMEGFNGKEFDKILGLETEGLESRVILALGFRSSEDGTQNMKKVRFSETEVFVDR